MSVSLISRDGQRVGIAEHDGNGLAVLRWFSHNTNQSMDYALQHDGYSVETVEEFDCRDVEPLISAICQRTGITMDAVFVPFSQSRNAKAGRDGKPWKSLNWRVTIRRHGRGAVETDYAQGYGSAPAHNRKDDGTRYGRQVKQVAIDREIETGMIHQFGEGIMYGSDGTRNTRKPIPAPSIGDVLQSLARDSDVLDAGGFESWAADYGYDTDSRAAESIYRACLEIAMKLRAGLGESLLAEIRLAASFN